MPNEERVAGSPEYVFNEYLSLTLTEGIVVCVMVLVAVGICLRMGVKRGRYGICGAILSLLVFSFSFAFTLFTFNMAFTTGFAE